MMNKEWKPVPATQKIVCQMLLNGWSKDKIISWFDEGNDLEAINDIHKEAVLMRWLNNNLKGDDDEKTKI